MSTSDPVPTTTTPRPPQPQPTSNPSHLSPQPSPPQQPPTSALLTTSTPGPRATALHQIFTTALTHTLNTALSYSNFSACFPTPAAHAPLILQSIWRQIRNLLEEKFAREYEDVLAEREVVKGLGEWEGLVAGARARKMEAETESQGRGADVQMTQTPQAPHLLPPQDLYAAHLRPFLRDAAAEIEMEMVALRAENLRLVAEVEAQGAEVERLVSGVEDVVGDLMGAGESMGGWVEGQNGSGKGGLSLGEEAREIDMEREMSGLGRRSRL